MWPSVGNVTSGSELVQLALVLDLLGTFFFAISGSLLAARRGFDIIGSLILGSLTGLGGGVVRDLILDVPPTAFHHPIYLAAPLAAALLVYFLYNAVERLPRTLLMFDAAGLGVFCTTGTVKALETGLNPVAAVLLGAATGIGGGLLRDIVANRDPSLFNPKELYAVPALLGATVIALVWTWGGYSFATAMLVAAGVFGMRVLSVRFGWRVPDAVAGWHSLPGDHPGS